MKCINRVSIIAVMMLMLVSFAVYSQERSPADNLSPITLDRPPFALGDQYFGIHVGVYIPLFLIDPEDGSTPDTNQSIGGSGSIQWNIYLNDFFSIGVETSYIFSFTPNENTISIWPTVIRASFAPLIGQVMIPLRLDFGMVFSYLDESTKFDMIIRGGTGFYWFFEPEWALGVAADYMFLPQIYNGTVAPASDTRILNALTAQLGVIYRL